MGAPAPPRAVKKFFRRNLHGKCVSAPPRTRSAPPARAGVNFRTVFAGRVRYGGAFRRSLTKKGRQLFLVRKSAPHTKSWLRQCTENVYVLLPGPRRPVSDVIGDD